MGKALTFCLIVVGLINFAPVLGVLSAQQLESAYSISLAGNDIAILMRHRAVLFGILGAFILYSAFKPSYQVAAMIMGGISMLAYALLAVSIGGYNDLLANVLFIDLLGIVFLMTAALLKYLFKAE